MPFFVSSVKTQLTDSTATPSFPFLPIIHYYFKVDENPSINVEEFNSGLEKRGKMINWHRESIKHEKKTWNRPSLILFIKKWQ